MVGTGRPKLAKQGSHRMAPGPAHSAAAAFLPTMSSTGIAHSTAIPGGGVNPAGAPAQWTSGVPSGAARPAVRADTGSVATTANQAVVSAAATPRKTPPLGELIGKAIFNTFEAVEKFVVGPPALPRCSTVTVRTSRVQINGHPVDANWYFPAGAPQGVIYLQHGVMAIGPMYSYTAAYLAEKTNSVVLAPTLTSNLFASDGFWLGGAPAQQGVAALFLGNRDALTASALNAGYAHQYGPGSVLPTKFVLAGHSLGGTTTSGAAGFYAQAVTDGGIDNNLAGVILFDATAGTALPAALEKLNGLKRYVPVLEIGAPRNNFDMLTASRPHNFNGVVLNRGVHMDSLQGGNPLIEFASYLFTLGFPRPQNPPATQILAAGWINDMLAGRLDPTTGACTSATCQGTYAGPGDTVVIDTDKGTATAVVIGRRPAGAAAPVNSAVQQEAS